MSPAESARLRAFFDAYATVALSDEPEKLAELYGSGFLVAGPGGSAVFTNNDEFLAWLRQLHDFNQASGMQSMEVVALAPQPLTDQFLIVTVEWGARFRQTGDKSITFRISYILETTESCFRVLGYISHEDQVEAMRARGLL